MTAKSPYERLLDTIQTYREDNYEIERIRVPQQFFDALVSDGNLVRPECDDTEAPDDPNTAQVAGYEVVVDDVHSIVVDVATETQVEFADDATLTVELDDGETLEYQITEASFESNENVYDEYPGIVTSTTDTMSTNPKTTVAEYTGSFTVNVEECNKEAYHELFGFDESDVGELFEQGASANSAWTLEELVELFGIDESDVDELFEQGESADSAWTLEELDTPHMEQFEHAERFEPTNDMHDTKYTTDPERIDEQLTEHPIPLGEAAVVYVNSLEFQELIAHDDFERVTEDDDIELHHPNAVGLFNGAEVVHDPAQQRAMVDTIQTQ